MFTLVRAGILGLFLLGLAAVVTSAVWIASDARHSMSIGRLDDPEKLFLTGLAMAAGSALLFTVLEVVARKCPPAPSHALQPTGPAVPGSARLERPAGRPGG